MSLYGYKESQKISETDPGFDALIFAAIRKADTKNLMILEHAFPMLVVEFKERYNAPGGVLDIDG